MQTLQQKYGNAVVTLAADLLDPMSCRTLIPCILEKTNVIDVFHANAGLYVGEDLVNCKRPLKDAYIALHWILPSSIVLPLHFGQ